MLSLTHSNQNITRSKTGVATKPLQMARDHSWPEIIKQYSRLYEQVLR